MTLGLDPVINFGKVEVSTGYDASATSIVLSSGDGAKLPSTFSYNITWWNSTDYADPTDDPNVEIVRVTNRVTDTLTVIRAQESTSASTKNTGGKTYKMILSLTKKMVDDIGGGLANVVEDITPQLGGNLDGQDKEIQKVILKDYAELTVANAAAGTTETLDIEAGNVFHMTLDENITFTFSNPIASDDMTSFTLILTQDGSGTNVVTWPASVDWAGGSAPTLITTAGTVSILVFFTIDGGTIWHGMLGSSDSS